MLRVRVVWTTTPSGGQYLSTHYFTGDDDASGAVAANAAVGAFWGAVDNSIHNTYAWATSSIVDVLDNTGELVGSHTVTPVTGVGTSSATDPLPFANQALVVWNTGAVINGRRLLGRTFVPGITEAGSVNGLLSASVRTSIDTAAEALIADTGADLAVWSKTNSQSFPATSADVRAQFAVLRSRRD